MRSILATLNRASLERYGDPADPNTVDRHRRIIQRKKFLKKTYADFYRDLRDSVESAPPGFVLELGSGGGFIKEIIPGALTSDIVALPWVDVLADADKMPFKSGSLAAIVCQDVLHHVPDPEGFIREASRCLRSGGKVVMHEPFNSPVSRFIFRAFHDEPFDERADWSQSVHWRDGLFANQALPWIMFVRDRSTFERRFNDLRISFVQPHTPLRWILSGGIRAPFGMPGYSYTVVRGAEWLLSPFRRFLCTHMKIELVRT